MRGMTENNMTPEELRKGAELATKEKPLTPAQEHGLNVLIKETELSDRLKGDVNNNTVYDKHRTSAELLVKLDELKKTNPGLEYKISNGRTDGEAIIRTNIKVGDGTLEMHVSQKGVSFSELPKGPNATPAEIDFTTNPKEAISVLDEYSKKSPTLAPKPAIDLHTPKTAEPHKAPDHGKAFVKGAGAASLVIGGTGIKNKLESDTYNKDLEAGGMRGALAKAAVTADGIGVASGISSMAEGVMANAPKVLGVVGKTSLPVAGAAAVLDTGTALAAGDIPRAEKAAVGSAGTIVGTIGGAAAGAKAGITYSPGDPRLKAIGGAVGGLVGGIIGYFGGTKSVDALVNNKGNETLNPISATGIPSPEKQGMEEILGKNKKLEEFLSKEHKSEIAGLQKKLGGTANSMRHVDPSQGPAMQTVGVSAKPQMEVASSR